MQQARNNQNAPDENHILTPIMEELISNTVFRRRGSDPISYKTNETKIRAPIQPKTVTKEKGILQENVSKSSLLYKNFAFRNAESLQRALDEEEKKLLQLHLATRAEHKEVYSVSEMETSKSVETKLSLTSTTESNLTEMKTQTETASVISLEQSRLKYLMGLPLGGEEDLLHENESITEEVIVDQQLGVGESEAMKQARRYLRVHKVFEFFQFIIAHLLSALPDNPIEFILDLLDKCIIFRAGLGPPPVLYDKKHIEALFYLMDRMRTGYIEKEQYHTGMKTLGICSYNPNPPTFAEDLVHKNYFVEEAYENMVCFLNDLIKRRWMYVSHPPRQMKTPPPTPQPPVSSGAIEAYKQ